jgi:hypothetical protein
MPYGMPPANDSRSFYDFVEAATRRGYEGEDARFLAHVEVDSVYQQNSANAREFIFYCRQVRNHLHLQYQAEDDSWHTLRTDDRRQALLFWAHENNDLIVDVGRSRTVTRIIEVSDV